MWLGCGIEDPGGSNSSSAERFLLLIKRLETLDPTHLTIEWVLGFFPVSKTTGACSSQLTPYSYEVKNRWSYTSTSLMYLDGVDGNNLFFYPLFLIIICSFHSNFFFRCVDYLKNTKINIYSELHSVWWIFNYVYKINIWCLFTAGMINIFLYNGYTNKRKDTFVYIFDQKICQYR